MYYIKTDGTNLYVAGDVVAGTNVRCLDGDFNTVWATSHQVFGGGSYLRSMEVYAGDGLYLGGRFWTPFEHIRKLSLATGNRIWGRHIGLAWETYSIHSDGTYVVFGSSASPNYGYSMSLMTVGGSFVWNKFGESVLLGSLLPGLAVYISGSNVWVISGMIQHPEGNVSILQRYKTSDGDFIEEESSYRTIDTYFPSESWRDGDQLHTLGWYGHRIKYNLTGTIGYDSRVLINLPNTLGFQCIKDGDEYIVSVLRVAGPT